MKTAVLLLFLVFCSFYFISCAERVDENGNPIVIITELDCFNKIMFTIYPSHYNDQTVEAVKLLCSFDEYRELL